MPLGVEHVSSQSRRPSQKVKVLKPEVSTDFRPCIAESQTFPEGKGVETRSSSLLLQPTRPGRRPSQKVKVLKLSAAQIKAAAAARSQTFPEGKGVETLGCQRSNRSRDRRRPSQKVKVLKRLPALTRPLSRH